MCRGTYAERIIFKIDKFAKGKITSSEDNELFQRLTRYANITNIELKYVDGVEEKIYADWEEATKGGEENLLQKNSFDERKFDNRNWEGDLNEYKKRKID